VLNFVVLEGQVPGDKVWPSCYEARPIGNSGFLGHEPKWQCRFLFGGSWSETPQQIVIDSSRLEEFTARAANIGFRVARDIER